MSGAYKIIGWILAITLLTSCGKKFDIRGKWYCNGIFVTKSGAWTETETEALKSFPDSVLFKKHQYVEYYSNPATEVIKIDLEIRGGSVKIAGEKYIIMDYTDSSFVLSKRKSRNLFGFHSYTDTKIVFGNKYIRK